MTLVRVPSSMPTLPTRRTWPDRAECLERLASTGSRAGGAHGRRFAGDRAGAVRRVRRHHRVPGEPTMRGGRQTITSSPNAEGVDGYQHA